jgi:hypothetical protein
MPEYKLEEFINACKALDVSIDKDAKSDASKDLNLLVDKDILEYVAEKQTDLNYVNTRIWENLLKNTGKKVMIDGYNFFENKKKYYLAFVKNLKGKWSIKSLHLDDSELVNKPFEDKLKGFKLENNGGEK